MSTDAGETFAPQVEAGLAELRQIITARYPEASFAVESGGEPEGIWLLATVDVDDRGEVFDLVMDRVLQMQFEEGLPLHVLPLRTPERNAAVLREQAAERRALLAVG